MLSNARRIMQINHTLVKYGLDELVLATQPMASIRWTRHLTPWRKAFRKDAPRGERIRLALEELGPVFIKFGQMLSTRRDLLPDDIADELIKLQDRVPPFPGEEAQAMIEHAYGKPVTDIFARFDVEPLASASVAQVHTAQLPTGEEVVVKVLRPNVDKLIKRDVDVMLSLASMADKYWSLSSRVHPLQVVREYEKTIFDELDLSREAANAALTRRNFENSALLYIPEVHWDYCNNNVLVLEKIEAIPVADVAQLSAQNTNMQLLAERGVEIFFTQVFRDNFFHADMHPGNIFVSREHPENPQYMAVDFGIVGSLTTEDQAYLAHNMLAFFNQDYRQVAQLHVDSGWVPADTRVDELESALRSVCEPIFGKPLADISFGHFLLQLFNVGRRFEMEVQPQLVLLQKTLLNIEGLGRQLYPELNLWDTAKPFLETWVKDQLNPKKQLEQALPHLQRLPQTAVRLLSEMEKGQLPIKLDQQLTEQMQTTYREEQRRGRRMMLGGCLAIAAAVCHAASSNMDNATLLLAIPAMILMWRNR